MNEVHDPRGAISVRARFDRLPTSLKGALILRGEDPNPHQVVFHGVRIAPVAGDDLAGKRVPVAAQVVHVAPRRDVFVPFEVGLGDLDPGWYAFRCAVAVDGIDAEFDGGQRFAISWPRGAVRRGAVAVGGALALGASTVRVEQLDCAADSVRIAFIADPPIRPTALAEADGQPLAVLEIEADDAGKGRVVTYPLLKEHRAFRLELHADGSSAALDVPLT